MQPALGFCHSAKLSVCVSVTYMFCESIYYRCQRKIGNKKEREKEKTRKQTYQRQIRAKVDHVTDCVFFPAHAVSRAGYTQFVR